MMTAESIKMRHWQITFTALSVSALVAGVAAQGIPAPAQAQSNSSFADPAFRTAWERTDLPVAQGRVNRTWVWGPAPGNTLQEPFKEGVGGTHLVQYFDKARMEINDPTADKNNPFFVTNGLLVVEMISGRMQTGSSQFSESLPSDLQIAGDAASDSPTYSALQNVASVGLPNADHRVAPFTTGSVMQISYMDKAGNLRGDVAGSPPTGVTVKAAAYSNETGHNIPDLFWSYLNSQGPLYQNGAYTNSTLFNWVSAFGYPVTEPYWTSIKVAGKDRMVLFQAFQRRILTYSPDNPDGWKVEMGNVGAQYYSWRYETPSIACQTVPIRGFGTVWANHRNVQQGLGCPAQYGPNGGSEVALQSVYQPFERGGILLVKPTVPLYPNLRGPSIYVFFDDNTFQQFDDTWSPGQPESAGLTPPSGRFEPVRDIGKVWREGTGARVRERLGWATAPEKSGPGAYQLFNNGEMFWSGTVNNIWVLYGTVSNYGGPPYTPSPGPTSLPGTTNRFRYDVYQDTFTP